MGCSVINVANYQPQTVFLYTINRMFPSKGQRSIFPNEKCFALKYWYEFDNLENC